MSGRALWLLAVLLIGPAVSAQNTAESDRSTAELVERAAGRFGDAEDWNGVAALEIRGTLGANGRENEVRLLRHRDGRVRYERRYRDLRMVFVDDGRRGRLLAFQADGFVEVDAATREQLLQSVDLIAPLPGSFSRTERVERLPAAPSGDGLVEVRLTPTVGLPLDLAIDPETARLERAIYRYVDAEDGGTYPMTVYLLEELEVATPGGRLLVSAYQERDEGTSVTVWIADSARFLGRVDDSEFEAANPAHPGEP